MNKARVEVRDGRSVDLTKMKNEQVYVNGRYVPGKLVPLSTEEITINKVIGRTFHVLGLTFFIALNGLLDFNSSPEGPLAITPFLSVPLIPLSSIGFCALLRLQDSVGRLQRSVDRYRGWFGPED
jgi:hypothetical protein